MKICRASGRLRGGGKEEEEEEDGYWGFRIPSSPSAQTHQDDEYLFCNSISKRMYFSQVTVKSLIYRIRESA